ncbi:MAG: glycosyltransferase [Verrucomicrobia bacterium]|nr:glycosyltransferase [Verrucomicrobiota bacterium]
MTGFSDGSGEIVMKDAGAPLVSIVVPCFNQGCYLPSAIESCLAQTHPNIEVIVINDGSTDNTDEAAARYPSIRYIAQENRGVGNARNAGLEHSRGEYVQFIDADDRLTPGAIESHLECFSAHPEAGFVVGDIEWINEEGKCTGRGNWPVLETNFYEELLRVNHVANTIAVLFKRYVLVKIGGFKSFFAPAEDYELLLRAARSFSSAHHGNVVAQYRRHGSNTSRKGAIMLRATNRVVCAERPFVAHSARLRAALRRGDQHWRDFFGGVAIKEGFRHLRAGNIAGAATTAAALMRYVRGRLIVIPWKYRHRGTEAARRRLRQLRQRLHLSPRRTGVMLDARLK